MRIHEQEVVFGLKLEQSGAEKAVGSELERPIDFLLNDAAGFGFAVRPGIGGQIEKIQAQGGLLIDDLDGLVFEHGEPSSQCFVPGEQSIQRPVESGDVQRTAQLDERGETMARGAGRLLFEQPNVFLGGRERMKTVASVTKGVGRGVFSRRNRHGLGFLGVVLDACHS